MKFFRSFKFALKGIIYTLKNERHMRIHVVASLCVFILSLFFNLNSEKYVLLFLTMASVMISEMINSSIECVVDIFAKDYNSIAKAAKDMAAGAVLIAAGFSVVVGVILFSDANSYMKMFNFFISYPISFLGLFCFLVISYFYIFWGPTEIKNYLNKTLSILKKILKNKLNGES